MLSFLRRPKTEGPPPGTATVPVAVPAPLAPCGRVAFAS